MLGQKSLYKDERVTCCKNDACWQKQSKHSMFDSNFDSFTGFYIFALQYDDVISVHTCLCTFASFIISLYHSSSEDMKNWEAFEEDKNCRLLKLIGLFLFPMGIWGEVS